MTCLLCTRPLLRDAAREFIDLFDEDQNGNIDASEFAKFYHSLLGGDGGSGAQARAKEVEAKGKKVLSCPMVV